MELSSWYKMDRAIGQFQIINGCEAKGEWKKERNELVSHESQCVFLCFIPLSFGAKHE